LVAKEKATYICSRFERNRVPKNIEKKPPDGAIVRGSTP